MRGDWAAERKTRHDGARSWLAGRSNWKCAVEETGGSDLLDGHA